MKTTNFKLLAILSIIIGIICIIGCKEIEELIEGKVSTDCPEGIYADTVPNQLIVHFDPKTQSGDKIDFFKWLIDTLGASEIRTCHCDEELALVEFPSNQAIDLNASIRQGNHRLKDEGDVFFNLKIDIEPIVGTPLQSYYTNDNTQGVIRNEDIAIAIIDGGLDPNRFIGYALPYYSYDFTKKDTTTKLIEINPHGTIIGRISVQGTDSSSIKIMDLKIFNKEGEGHLFNGLCAISHAIKNKADIINMSWGFYDISYNSLFLKYMEKAKSNNVFIVASAGNDNLNTDNCIHFPSGFNSGSFTSLGNVVSVASLEPGTSNLTKYSNFGPKTIGIASYEGEVTGFGPYEGTSFSAPMVINKAIPIMQETPGISCTLVEECILGSAEAITDLKVISGGKLKEGDIMCP